MMQGTDVEISILLLTYNHEDYVRQALDSIIKQKIEVSYEILVVDDASIDRTPEILKEYKRKYPQKITLYLRKVNSCHLTRNCYYLLSKAKGRYYAMIEGDDYWTDSLKIQKQYEFMERHKQYSACVTDVDIIDENNDKVNGWQAYIKKENCIFKMQDFLYWHLPGRMVTLFARNSFALEEYSIVFKADRNIGDMTIFMLCLMEGDIYQLSEKMAVYRYVNSIGKNNFTSIHKDDVYYRYDHVRYWILLENYLMKHYSSSIRIIPAGRLMAEIASQYSLKAMWKLIEKSMNRRKYLLAYLIGKLLDSNFVKKKELNEKFCESYSWIRFRKINRFIILFGAGAVAEEYISKYGWIGNIAFLVDNDVCKQYASYHGYLIKSPQEIVKYKGKAIVLITNREHEKDIEEQLKKMGIEDYYCYCTMQASRPRNWIAEKMFQLV